MMEKSKTNFNLKIIYIVAGILLLLILVIVFLIVRGGDSDNQGNENDTQSTADDRESIVISDNEVLPFEDNVDRIIVKPAGTAIGIAVFQDEEGLGYYPGQAVWIDGSIFYSQPSGRLSDWGFIIHDVAGFNQFIADGFDNSNDNHPCGQITDGEWSSEEHPVSGDVANILGPFVDHELIKNSKMEVICFRVQVSIGDAAGRYVYRSYYLGGEKLQTNKVFYNPSLYESALSLPNQVNYKEGEYRQFNQDVITKLNTLSSDIVSDIDKQTGFGAPDLGYEIFIREHYFWRWRGDSVF